MQNLEKHVNFENENSRKAYYREFKKVHCSLMSAAHRFASHRLNLTIAKLFP